MNYYKRHIGDYIRDTAHLSLLEHGVYTRLLDIYYIRENGIPDDQAARLIGARSKDEVAALRAVLGEFFTLTDGVWVQSRCDLEIRVSNEKAERNRSVGAMGGRPKPDGSNGKPRNNPDGFQNGTQKEPRRNPDGSQMETQTVSKNNPSHKPLAISQEEDVTTASAVVVPGEPETPQLSLVAGREVRAPHCPHEAIIAAYHQHLPMLPAIAEWSDKRRALLATRWKENPDRQTVQWWADWFKWIAAECPFLVGQGSTSAGREPFLANLEWLIRPTNFLKVIEGHYQRETRIGGSNG